MFLGKSTKFGLVLLLAGLSAACSPSPSVSTVRSSGVRAAQDNPTTPGSGGLNDLDVRCSNGQSAVGYVGDNAPLMVTGTFKDRVGQLVSATIDPSSFGDISGTPGADTGIDLYLQIKTDGSGQVVTTGSNLKMVIYDSFVGQIDATTGKSIPAYPISISAAATGSVNASAKTFTVTFQDAYGSVTIYGQWDATSARGTVEFQNFRHFSGGTPASGTLGNFAVPTCGLFP